MVNKGLFSSKSVEWETPQILFDALNHEFGFTLDVCASEKNFKCEKYFDIKTNGLTQDWSGNICWMNPPYGREIGKWVAKAAKEARNGATVVCLLPARTDTRWFHDFIWDYINSIPRSGVEIRFLKGRIKFVGAKNSAPFPSMIVIFRPDILNVNRIIYSSGQIASVNDFPSKMKINIDTKLIPKYKEGIL